MDFFKENWQYNQIKSLPNQSGTFKSAIRDKASSWRAAAQIAFRSHIGQITWQRPQCGANCRVLDNVSWTLTSRVVCVFLPGVAIWYNKHICYHNRILIGDFLWWRILIDIIYKHVCDLTEYVFSAAICIYFNGIVTLKEMAWFNWYEVSGFGVRRVMCFGKSGDE